jgi:branched-chain amino acid transport system ATP-binding protein
MNGPPDGSGPATPNLSTALRGLVPRPPGTVALDGVDVTGWPPQRLVSRGLVRTFQDVATFPGLSVFENVELGALGGGLSRRKARERAWELIENMGLQKVARLSASALPHGDERRVGIARAVAVSPTFLLLDEPAAGLDDAESLTLTKTIANLRDELGCGVLLVEHDMRIIFRVCERIQVLDHGKSIAVGSPEEIRTDRRVIAAYLGEKGAQIAAAH